MTVEQFPKRAKASEGAGYAKLREAEAELRKFAREHIADTMVAIEAAARHAAECVEAIARYAEPEELDLLHKASRLSADIERLRALEARR